MKRYLLPFLALGFGIGSAHADGKSKTFALPTTVVAQVLQQTRNEIAAQLADAQASERDTIESTEQNKMTRTQISEVIADIFSDFNFVHTFENNLLAAKSKIAWDGDTSKIPTQDCVLVQITGDTLMLAHAAPNQPIKLEKTNNEVDAGKAITLTK